MDIFVEKNIELVDAALRDKGFGGISSSTYNVFRGLNVMGGIPALPHNSDNQGLVFFTKPDMNLSYDNVINHRKLAFLADSNTQSMGCLIKCMLSPTGTAYTEVQDNVRSSIVDDRCAFLPISNILLQLSNPPDIAADTFTTSEGWVREQMAWVDSRPGVFNVYDLTATFTNMEGDPVSSIFDVWIEYSQRVAEGTMLPYPLNIVENRIDYQTRIYRLILDRSRTFVQKIWSNVASFPYTNPVGAIMGYNTSTHISIEANEIQIMFKCMGSLYNDPFLVKDFNDLVMRFNENMREDNRGNMIKVDGTTGSGINKKAIMGNRLYPFITNTMELEWYANREEYNIIMEGINTIESRTTFSNANIVRETILNPWADSIKVRNNTTSTDVPARTLTV